MLRIALITLATAAAAFAATYSVAPIPAPSGFANPVMAGINNAGQVAGYGTVLGGLPQAFVGSPSGSIAIPLPAGYSKTQGLAINASGQVAGSAGGNVNFRAFIGTPGGSAVIPVSAFAATGNGVNDSGQVAGSITTPSLAFLGSTSGSAIIAAGGLAQGEAVNNLGQVAGEVVVAGPNRAFIGTAASSTLIPLPTGFMEADGFAVNDSGQVAGGVGNPGGLAQAYIGTTAAATVIPLPLGATQAYIAHGSLNNSGLVVGQSDAGGWIWDSTNGTRLLNTFVPSGWNVTNGVSISNNGLILAQASFQGGALQYVELTPSIPATPAPSTLVLFVIGAIFCAILYRN